MPKVGTGIQGFPGSIADTPLPELNIIGALPSTERHQHEDGWIAYLNGLRRLFESAADIHYVINDYNPAATQEPCGKRDRDVADYGDVLAKLPF